MGMHSYSKYWFFKKSIKKEAQRPEGGYNSSPLGYKWYNSHSYYGVRLMTAMKFTPCFIAFVFLLSYGKPRLTYIYISM